MLAVSGHEALAAEREVVAAGYGGDITVFYYLEPERHSGLHAFLLWHKKPQGVIRPHFHAVDQFQVFARGDGSIGKSAATPVTVHYSDRYSTYGPIVGGEDGIGFYTLRKAKDPGPQYMPESRLRKLRRSGRNLTSKPIGAGPPSQAAGARTETLIEEHRDGLAAWVLSLPPGEAAAAPDPSGGGGQYLLVVGGSAAAGGQDLPAWSCGFVDPAEPPARLTAGSEGASVLVLQYPAGV